MALLPYSLIMCHNGSPRIVSSSRPNKRNQVSVEPLHTLIFRPMLQARTVDPTLLVPA